MSSNYVRLIVAGVIGCFSILVLVLAFDLVPIHGNEIGVKETWFAGVLPDPLPARTYWVLPWERIQVYPTSVKVFVMNDNETHESQEGRDTDSYLVQSADSQDMHLSLQVQWRIDPLKVVDLHKTVGPEYIEEKVLRPTMLRVVKDEATTRQALQAYSGVGLVDLQQAIEKDLNDPVGELRSRGIIVDAFVIEHIKLDSEYVAEITARQVAIQKESRAVQEEKVAQVEALKAKAVARAAYETAVVKAEQDKAVQVLAAEAMNEQQILAAEAEKRKTVLAAEAEKESGQLKGDAILAIGKATAEARTLELSAYNAPGAETYAKIQIANAMGSAFAGIKGYLPESMTVNTLGASFLDAVESFVTPQVAEK